MLLRSDWDQLLLAARDGDVSALGRLVEVASEDLRTMASGVVGRATQTRLPVEDVFSDAMMAAFQEIRSLRATSYLGFRYWFASIARNQVRRALRNGRSRPEQEALDSDEDDCLDPLVAITAENQGFVRHALERLPKSQQIAFVLREGLGLAWLSIAFVLERRATAAARLIHYRAVVSVKEVAETRPDLRLLVQPIRA